MITLTVYYHSAMIAPLLVIVGFVIIKTIIEIIPL
jgi:hypothetical protein